VSPIIRWLWAIWIWAGFTTNQVPSSGIESVAAHGAGGDAGAVPWASPSARAIQSSCGSARAALRAGGGADEARQQRRQGRGLEGTDQVGREFGSGQGERQDKRNMGHAVL
jgi:hypothetical protein